MKLQENELGVALVCMVLTPAWEVVDNCMTVAEVLITAVPVVHAGVLSHFPSP